MFIQLPLPHVRGSTKGLGRVRSQLCVLYPFLVQKANKTLQKYLLCTHGDLEVFGKIFPLGDPSV